LRRIGNEKAHPSVVWSSRATTDAAGMQTPGALKHWRALDAQNALKMHSLQPSSAPSARMIESQDV